MDARLLRLHVDVEDSGLHFAGAFDLQKKPVSFARGGVSREGGVQDQIPTR